MSRQWFRLKPGDSMTTTAGSLVTCEGYGCGGGPMQEEAPRQPIKIVLPEPRQQVEVVLPTPTPGPIKYETRIKDLLIGQYGYVTPSSVIIRDNNNKLFVQTNHMSYTPGHISWAQTYKVLRAHDGYEIEGPAFVPEQSNMMISTTKPVVAWKVTN